MKRISGLTNFLLVAVLLLSTTVFNVSLVFANNSLTVEIDGQRVNFSDQQPVIIDSRTLVPVRGIFEQLGYTVSWEQSIQTATLSNGVNTVIITVGKSTFTTNGNTYSLDVPAQVINNRTMLPFRAVLESIGCSVDWNGGSNTIIVSHLGSNSQAEELLFSSEKNTDIQNAQFLVVFGDWGQVGVIDDNGFRIRENSLYNDTIYKFNIDGTYEYHWNGLKIKGTYSISDNILTLNEDEISGAFGIEAKTRIKKFAIEIDDIDFYLYFFDEYSDNRVSVYGSTNKSSSTVYTYFQKENVELNKKIDRMR